MGSFDYTCAVSGLPIGANDDVRFILLQASPYNRGGCHADSAECWYLRAPPIRAKYNDYGSVENVHPDDESLVQLWLDGLKVDLIEKGVGDNTCHDVAVRKAMTFDELCEALWENRVEVRRELDPNRDTKFDKLMSKYLKKTSELGQGIPSLQRIEEVIKSSADIEVTVKENILKTAEGVELNLIYKKADGTDDDYLLRKFQNRWKQSIDDKYFLNVSTLGTSDGQLIVDEIQRGEIRVRVGGYANIEESLVYLNPLLEKLQKDYAAVITCGSGSYADRAELSIRPKPGTKNSDGHCFSLYQHASNKGPEKLLVRACMVREDVWQALLTMGVEAWNKDYKTVNYCIDNYRAAAKEAWDEFNKRFVKKEKRLDIDESTIELLDGISLYTWKTWWHDSYNPVGSLVCDNPSIGAFGMNTSFAMMAYSLPEQKDIDNFCNVIAETALISDVLRTIRMSWRPESNHSPQFGEWEAHRDFHLKMAECTFGEIAEREKRRKEDEEWQKQYAEQQKAKEAKKAKNKAKKAKAKKAVKSTKKTT